MTWMQNHAVAANSRSLPVAPQQSALSRARRLAVLAVTLALAASVVSAAPRPAAADSSRIREAQVAHQVDSLASEITKQYYEQRVREVEFHRDILTAKQSRYDSALGTLTLVVSLFLVSLTVIGAIGGFLVYRNLHELRKQLKEELGAELKPILERSQRDAAVEAVTSLCEPRLAVLEQMMPSGSRTDAGMSEEATLSANCQVKKPDPLPDTSTSVFREDEQR
jgi:hypothetical protein